MIIKNINGLIVREFESKEEEENWKYPKAYPCWSCPSSMLRVGGDSFYKYSYLCKCGKQVYGPQRTEIDDETELVRINNSVWEVNNQTLSKKKV